MMDTVISSPPHQAAKASLRSLKMLLLGLALLAGVFGCMQTIPAFAQQAEAETITMKQVSNSTTNFNYGITYRTSDGETVFCCQHQKPGPDTSGQKYVSIKDKHQDAYDYIMYHGYPNTQTINGKKWSKTDASDITQVAVWHIRDNDYYGGWSSTSVKAKAALALCKKAKAYDGNGPEQGSATVWEAASNPDSRQILVSSSPLRRLEIQKKSASPSLTKGNANYSLKGAKFGVYASRDDAKNGKNILATLTTDAKGDTDSVRLAVDADTFYVKEIKAPKGFLLSDTIKPVNVPKKRSTITVTFTDSINPAHVKVAKASSNTDITNGNTCYSFKGAKFGVYKTAAAAKAATAAKPGAYVSLLTTGADGMTGTSKALGLGTYYIKELKAPTGFRLNESVATVKLTTAGQTKTVTIKDEPQRDPISALLKKIDADTGLASAQGDGTLANAQFTVNFYASAHSASDIAGKNPTRTWVFKTGANGKVDFTDKYKVSGDKLWADAPIHDQATLPLGVVTIQETQAPAGYLLPAKNDPALFVISADSQPIVNVDKFNAPTISENALHANFEFYKVASSSKDGGDGQENLVAVPGVEFQIINKSDKAVVSPVDGKTEVKPGEVLCTVTADKEGHVSTAAGKAVNGWDIPSGWNGALAAGHYAVHEMRASESGKTKAAKKAWQDKYDVNLGYMKDFSFDIDPSATDGSMVSGGIKSNHTGMPLKIVKQDVESGKAIPMAGFRFLLYDDQGKLVTYTLKNTDETFGTEENPWTTDSTGSVSLPMELRQMTYTVVEAHVADGSGYVNGMVDDSGAYVYDESGNLKPAQTTITIENGNEGANGAAAIATIKDMPVKGKVSLTKTATDDNSAVAGATYEVRAAGDITTADGTVHAKDGETVATLTTDENGHAESGLLYCGSYNVVETASPDGYAENDTVYPVTIASAGETVPIVTVNADAQDTPTTLKISKASAKDGSVLAGAAFQIKNADGSYDQTITTGDDGTATLTKIPRGEYTVTETKAPDGYRLDDSTAHSLIVNEHGLASVDGGEPAAIVSLAFKDTPKEIHTTATADATQTHEVQAGSETGLTDVVAIGGGTAGATYHIKGTLMDKSTGKAIEHDGQLVTAEKTFTLDDTQSVSLAFTVDTSDLEGHDIVVFEDMHEGDSDQGTEFAKHEDINDEGQTVHVVNIHTNATDSGTKDHQGTSTGKETIIDTVSYTNLKVGTEYTVTGTLMDKGTGKALVGENGSAITVTKKFTPTEANGTVEVPFEIDSSLLAGKSTVAFENLYNNGVQIAVHNDLTDTDQTVHHPAVHTTAISGDMQDHFISAEKDAVITDKVELTNLIPGETYTVKGTLMDKSTGKAVTVDGKAVTAETTFKADSENPTVNVEFKFDASKLVGHDLVVFEDLVHNDVTVAHHKDLKDKDQTVHATSMHTTATDKADGDHQIGTEPSTITDRVEYSGLTKGATYTVKGTLMDKSTGKAVTVDGKEITATKTFKAAKSSGTVDLDYEIDATKLAGHDLVVFEKAYDADNTLVAHHENIDDKGQTVHVKELDITGGTYHKTGNPLFDWLWLIIAAIVGGGIALGYGLHKRRQDGDKPQDGNAASGDGE
jgi:TQXA domain-containing protein